MSKKAMRSGLLLALGMTLVSVNVLAESAPVPLPRRRPPLESDRPNIDPAIKPVLTREEGQPSDYRSLTETSAEKEARQKEASELLTQEKARAEAESLALAAESRATRAFIALKDSEALASSWNKKATAANDDWQKALKAAADTEKSRNELLARMKSNTTLSQKSALAELHAKQLRFSVNAASYEYAYRELRTKYLEARVIALQQQLSALQLRLEAMIARERADSFRPDYKTDASKEKKARDAFQPVQAELAKVSQELKGALTLKNSASESFYKLKAEYDAAAVLAELIANAVKTRDVAYRLAMSLNPATATELQIAQVRAQLAKAKAVVALAQHQAGEINSAAMEQADGIAKTANLRQTKIQEATRLLLLAQENAKTATKAVAKIEADSKESISKEEALFTKSPSVLGLANLRVQIGKAKSLLLQAKVNSLKAAMAVSEARLGVSENFFETEEPVKKLLPLAAKDLRANLKKEISALEAQVAEVAEQSMQMLIHVEAAESQVNLLKDFNQKAQNAKANLTEKSEELVDRQNQVADARKTYDETMLKDIAPDKKAEARLPLDRAKAHLAELEASLAGVALRYEQATYDMALAAEKTGLEIVALYPFPALDSQKANITYVQQAEEKFNKAEAESKRLAEAVITSRLAVLDIQKKMKVAGAAGERAQTLLADAERSKERAEKQQLETEGLLGSAKTTLQQIAARVAPSVFSDSQIESYRETKKARTKAEIKKAIDTAQVHVNEDAARADAFRADIIAAKDSLAAAKAVLSAAEAKYRLEYSKRDGLESKQLSLAAANVDLAHDSLSVAEVNLRKSYMVLLKALDESNVGLAALQTEIEKSSDASSDKVKELIKKNGEEKTALSDAIAAMDEDARKATFARLNALTAHGEALMTGKMSRLISLEDLADQKAVELDGHLCTKRDTDPITCLACNVVFEARVDQSFQGKLLPARTTMVRFNKGLKRWGDSVCGVVHQRDYIKKRKAWNCEYSWSCEVEDAIVALNKKSTKKTRARYDYFKMSVNDRDEILAALVAYYETKVPYSWDSYWNSKLVAPYWVDSDCKAKSKIGLHTVCRVAGMVDEQEANEEARMRVRTDSIDPATIDP